jgi:hypothetical protein
MVQSDRVLGRQLITVVLPALACLPHYLSTALRKQLLDASAVGDGRA